MTDRLTDTMTDGADERHRTSSGQELEASVTMACGGDDVTRWGDILLAMCLIAYVGLLLYHH
jgi:hypothetical protein